MLNTIIRRFNEMTNKVMEVVHNIVKFTPKTCDVNSIVAIISFFTILGTMVGLLIGNQIK
jgi:hypothetical protein